MSADHVIGFVVGFLAWGVCRYLYRSVLGVKD